MKKLLILALILFCAAAGWSVGQRLSSDALSMAIGILFGILAGIPAALLVMAAGRRGERTPEPPKRMPQEYGGGFQAPVIVVSPPGAQYPQGYGQQSPQARRAFYLPCSFRPMHGAYESTELWESRRNGTTTSRSRCGGLFLMWFVLVFSAVEALASAAFVSVA
ncbi:MAG: hypothetical protein R2856_17175 [Caldilineaceae bacterium]